MPYFRARWTSPVLLQVVAGEGVEGPAALSGLILAALMVGDDEMLRTAMNRVDEDKAFGVEIELPVKPVEAFLQHIRAILLDGVPGLFFS